MRQVAQEPAELSHPVPESQAEQTAKERNADARVSPDAPDAPPANEPGGAGSTKLTRNNIHAAQ